MLQVFACTTAGELTTVTYLCPRFSSLSLSLSLSLSSLSLSLSLSLFFFGGGLLLLFLVRVSHGRPSGKLNTNCGLVTILNLLCSWQQDREKLEEKKRRKKESNESHSYCPLFHNIYETSRLHNNSDWLESDIIIVITAVIFIEQYLSDKGEHIALYKFNKNVYIKPQK